MMIRPHGGQPISYDPRDEQFTQITFGAVTLPVFPKTLGRKRRPVKNQGTSVSCTAQTTALAAEYQDGEELSAAWTWKEVCKYLGTFTPPGAQPRDAMSRAIAVGFLPQRHAKYSFPQDNTQTIGNWNNWPDQYALAEPFKKAAYVRIPIIADYFDSIKAALVHGKEKNQIVMAFGTWYTEWNIGKFIALIYSILSGWHAYTFIDFDTVDGVEYLIAQNSYGETMGEQGFQWFPRETVNREFSRWGTGLYVFVDLTPEQIALAKQDTVFGKIQRAIIQAWWTVTLVFGKAFGSTTEALLPLYKRLLDLIAQLLGKLQPVEPPVVPVAPPEPPKPKRNLLREFCLCIREYEGWYAPGDHPQHPQGSKSWRNNNPGNCRYSSKGYLPMYGMVKKDKDNFAIFGDYATGWMYLQNLVKSKIKDNPEHTLIQFFQVYAPAEDHNNPVAYATYVAKKLRVPVETRIKQLLA
jgi:hypothetical protein